MFTIEIKDAEVERALTGLQALLSDLSQVMGQIGDALVQSTQDRMLIGQSPDGSPFAPRAASTLKAYEKKGEKPGPYPLWLTQTMRRGINFRSGPDFVSVGSNALQAAVMQFGAKQGQFGARMGRTKQKDGGPASRDYFHHLPWGDIPARPFLGLSDTDRSNILDIVREAFEAQVGG